MFNSIFPYDGIQSKATWKSKGYKTGAWYWEHFLMDAAFTARAGKLTLRVLNYGEPTISYGKCYKIIMEVKYDDIRKNQTRNYG